MSNSSTRTHPVHARCDSLRRLFVVIGEARRQNGTIQKIKHRREPLCHLLNETGVKSEHFPESVRELLKLNGNLTSLRRIYRWLTQLCHTDGELYRLVKFYGRIDKSKSRSEDINWFLQFSGVVFQYVHIQSSWSFPPLVNKPVPLSPAFIQ